MLHGADPENMNVSAEPVDVCLGFTKPALRILLVILQRVDSAFQSSHQVPQFVDFVHATSFLPATSATLNSTTQTHGLLDHSARLPLMLSQIVSNARRGSCHRLPYPR